MSTSPELLGAPTTPDDAAANDHRVGLAAGFTAYGLWGVFPLVFHLLGSVNPVEVLAHRIIWSAVAVSIGLVVTKDRKALDLLRTDRKTVARLAGAGALLAANWGVYVWAVHADRIVEAALGYYITPLLTAALGVGLLKETLRRAQVVALGLGVIAVVVLTFAYGRPPWVALVLAGTFSLYSLSKRTIRVGSGTSLALETFSLAPIAAVGLIVAEVTGGAAFGHGSLWRDLLLVSLGGVTAIPLLFFGTAASRIPLSTLGLLQYVTPTMQLLCGVAILGESLPPSRIAGFAIVWVALVVLTTDAVRTARASRLVVAPEAV